jgi:ferredoxin--NADP+ reductase
VAGLPFDEQTGTVPHREGRVVDLQSGNAVPGVYAAGWIKRGPSGVIGTNKFDSGETISALLGDHAAGRLPAPSADPAGMTRLVAERQPNALTYEDWKAIDRHERALGAPKGRPRVKLTDVDMMVAVALARSTPGGHASDAESLVADGVWL